MGQKSSTMLLCRVRQTMTPGAKYDIYDCSVSRRVFITDISVTDKR